MLILLSVIMRCHRRRAAGRAADEIVTLTAPMEQVSVERWLEEQNSPAHTDQYAQDTWYVHTPFVVDPPLWSSGPGPRRPYVLAHDVVRGMPRPGP